VSALKLKGRAELLLSSAQAFEFGREVPVLALYWKFLCLHDTSVNIITVESIAACKSCGQVHPQLPKSMPSGLRSAAAVVAPATPLEVLPRTCLTPCTLYFVAYFDAYTSTSKIFSSKCKGSNCLSSGCLHALDGSCLREAVRVCVIIHTPCKCITHTQPRLRMVADLGGVPQNCKSCNGQHTREHTPSTWQAQSSRATQRWTPFQRACHTRAPQTAVPARPAQRRQGCVRSATLRARPARPRPRRGRAARAPGRASPSGRPRPPAAATAPPRAARAPRRRRQPQVRAPPSSGTWRRPRVASPPAPRSTRVPICCVLALCGCPHQLQRNFSAGWPQPRSRVIGLLTTPPAEQTPSSQTRRQHYPPG